jgi:RNA polymerase sigma-70 factor (ECF subfamily)
MPHPASPYYHLSDLDLFNLFKLDDVRAFEVVYNRLWPELLESACRKLGSKQKAEDLVQEIFVSLFNKKNVLEISVSPKAYLLKALKYRVLNEYRSESVRTSHLQSLFFSPVCKIDLAKDFETRELHRHIELMIEQLPDKCRQVYLMSRDIQMTNKEIAQELSISVSTVEKHIGKALKILRSRIRELIAAN